MNMKILKTLILFGAVFSMSAIAQGNLPDSSNLGMGAGLQYVNDQIYNNTGNGSLPVQQDCTPGQYADEILEVAEGMEISSCYDNRQTLTTLPPPRPGTHHPRSLDLELLKGDFQICKCLRDKADKIKAYDSLFSKAKAISPKGDDDEKLQNFERRAKWITNKVKEKRVSLAFQASILFDGNPDMSFGYKNGVVDNLIGSKTSDLEKMTKDMSLSKPLAAGVRRILEKLDTPAKPNEALFIEQPFIEGQCVGAREFLAYRQLPSGEVIQDLRENQSFDENSWDIQALKRSINEMRNRDMDDLAVIGRIQTLSAKIKFLNRNPLIRTMMSANTEISDSASDAEKLAVETKKKHKQELFEILKKSAGNGGCLSAVTCQDSAFKDNNSVDYKKRLQEFFSRGEVAEAAKKETELEISNDMAKLKNAENFLPWNVPLTQRAVLSEFIESAGSDMNPENCTNSNGEGVQRCAAIYGAFCQNLDQVKSRIENRQSEDPRTLRSDEEVDSKNDFNPDLRTNIDFQEFNRHICNTLKDDNFRDQKGGVTFFDFQKTYCEGNTNKPECSDKSAANIRVLRQKYLDTYDKHNLFNQIAQKDPTEDVPRAGVEKITSTTNNSTPTNWNELAARNNYSSPDSPSSRSNSNSGMASTIGPPEKAVPFSGLAKSLSNLSTAMGGSESSDGAVDNQMNYSNAIMGGSQVPGQNAEVPKVENMPQTEREELLEDWKKEMAEWKAKKNSADPSEASVASANETAMKAKIEALEQLLAQQKKLTEDQYKLLNDSIAAQTQIADRTIASVQEDSEQGPRSNRRRSSNGIVSSNADLDDDTQRSAVSGQDQQQNTSGIGSGGGAAASSRSRSASSNAISDNSRDSVAREEAKLVNLRENSNGSITITSSAGGAGAASANAIVVPVSDAFYLSAQSNPSGLNLSQLEQSIPKDQIARLQDKGDYFILLLQNGTNPPLEVKVKKENNKLVQVDGAPIVSRRVSLEGLLNTLPTRVPASIR